MLLATVSSALRDFGAVCAALGAVIVTAGLLTRAKPVRWFFRTTVGDPVTRWHRAQTLYVVEAAIAPIHEQLKPNGGQSVRDRIDLLERLVRSQGHDITTSRQRDEDQDAADPSGDVVEGAADRAAAATSDQ